MIYLIAVYSGGSEKLECMVGVEVCSKECEISSWFGNGNSDYLFFQKHKLGCKRQNFKNYLHTLAESIPNMNSVNHTIHTTTSYNRPAV